MLISSSKILKGSLRGEEIDSGGESDTISKGVSVEIESSTSDSKAILDVAGISSLLLHSKKIT